MTIDLATIGPEAAIDHALARGVVANFLSRLLAPSEAGPGRTPGVRHGGRAALEAAASLLDRAGDERLRRAAAALVADLPPTPGSHERLFGHTLRGAVCPYESEYGKRALIQQAHELADLAGFYEAFGLRMPEGRRERVDHVACELEFLGFLSCKEAWALEAGEAELVEITRNAIGQFLGEHLGRFGRAFAVSLQTADPRGTYGRAGELCEAFLEVECERFRVPLGPALLELRSAREDAVPMACGSGEDLVQIGPPGDPHE